MLSDYKLITFEHQINLFETQIVQIFVLPTKRKHQRYVEAVNESVKQCQLFLNYLDCLEKNLVKMKQQNCTNKRQK